MNDQPRMDDCPEELIPTRKSLLGRLKNWQDNESWRDFFNTYWKLIYGFAMQRGLSHQEAEEVVQETVLAVAKSIPRFEYDPVKCAFKTWLLTVTRSKIANQFEKRARRPVMVGPSEDSRQTPLMERLPDNQVQQQWEHAWDDEWRKNLMDAAIQRVKRRVSIEQFQMFDLFVLKNWPARDVAKALNVTIAHIYVAKHRIAKLIRQEAKALEAKGV
ncbi:MAG TPA: sigma-70 family RNA polymerase sigma factor [Methylomirabilota bacterium]|nr:sigma-70 family RNA polymerase sigma factor [Methylomirabilota bacterium]